MQMEQMGYNKLHIQGKLLFEVYIGEMTLIIGRQLWKTGRHFIVPCQSRGPTKIYTNVQPFFDDSPVFYPRSSAFSNLLDH